MTRIGKAGDAGISIPGLPLPIMAVAPAFSSNSLGSTFTQVAQMGYVRWADAATHNLAGVIWRTGTVTAGSGSTLRVSLQDISAATAPMQPDGTIDQSVETTTMPGSNAVVSSTFGTARSNVAEWTPLSVVWDFNPFGSSTIVPISARNMANAASNRHVFAGVATYSSGSWAAPSLTLAPNVIFFSDDATPVFGWLEGTTPCSAVNTHTTTSASDPYVYALDGLAPFDMEVYGVEIFVNPSGTTNDFAVKVWDADGAVLGSITVDSTQVRATNTVSPYRGGFTPFTISGGTRFRAGAVPLGDDLSVYSLDVNAAGHLDCYSGGQDFCAATLSSSEVWSSLVTTRRPLISLLVREITTEAGGDTFVYRREDAVYLGEFSIGETIRYKQTFKNSSDAATDPTSPTARHLAPGGTFADLTVPGKIDSVTGQYGGTIDTAGYAAGCHSVTMRDTVLTSVFEFTFVLRAVDIDDIAGTTFVSSTDSLGAIRDAIGISGGGNICYYGTFTRVVGDNDGGTSSDTNSRENAAFVTGENASGLHVTASFNVGNLVGERLSRADFRWRYSGAGGHEIAVTVYNHDTEAWEAVTTLTNSTSLVDYEQSLAQLSTGTGALAAGLPIYVHPTNRTVDFDFIHNVIAYNAAHYLSIDYACVETTLVAVAPTASENADAVWEELLADHPTAGTTGNALAEAATASDVSTQVLSALTTYDAATGADITALGTSGVTIDLTTVTSKLDGIRNILEIVRSAIWKKK